MSSDHRSISFKTGLMSFEGANNKFICITLDKINDVSNNPLISMKYSFYQHILCLIVQHNDIKVFHDVANTDSELILSKLVPFLSKFSMNM